MLAAAVYRQLYREMLRIRMVEETIAARYSEQEMRCPVHLCIGQEATPAGVCSQLRKSDAVFSNHRSHGHYLAKGGSLRRMMAEIYGKVTGCCQGKGGSMHLIDLEAGFYGSTSIVSGTIPVAVGAAFGWKLQNLPRIAVAFFGDAATEEGVFHESMNFAVLHQLPVLFICENNLYSVYTPLADRRPNREIADQARSYGMESISVDGNDVVAVYEAAQKAIDKARNGGGPTFMECKTYRWREHCGPNYDNDLGYRDPAEFEAWRLRCPIETFERFLQANQMITPVEMERIKTEIGIEINEAFEYAGESPFPEPDRLYADLYTEV
jgi:pyruvate dehydrogenase E1 component alpha subunit